MGIKFEFLDAGNGDCIWITTDEGINILIDGGWSYTYDKMSKKKEDRLQRDDIKTKVKNLRANNQKLDLVVLTHYDDDHIIGLYKLLEAENKQGENTIIKEIWFNAFEKGVLNPLYSNNKQVGAPKQKQFEEVIEKILYIEYHDTVSIDEIRTPVEKDRIVVLSPYTDKDYLVTKEIALTLLSPNNEKIKELKEEYDDYLSKQSGAKVSDWTKSIESLRDEDEYLDEEEANGSSIAFILEYSKEKFLFLGDAHINLIAKSLKEMGYSVDNPLEVQFIKLSHHGSINNISKEFLSLVKTREFVVLAKSPTTHKHPDKETLVKIIEYYRGVQSEVNFKFNYELETIFPDITLFESDELSRNNLLLIETSKNLKFVYQNKKVLNG